MTSFVNALLQLCTFPISKQDENGLILGRSSKLNIQNLEEGSRFLVGSKEVEVIINLLSLIIRAIKFENYSIDISPYPVIIDY